MKAHGKVSTKYADHVEPQVKKVHGNVKVAMATVQSATNKVSAAYTDNVAPHVDKASKGASCVFNEKVVPAAKQVGAKAATTFNETVVPKVKEHATNLKEQFNETVVPKVKEHATNLKEHPKLKEFNDKATVKYQEGKAHATTKCTEFADKVVAAICTPKVKEVHGKVKESEHAQKLSKAYDAHVSPKVESFKQTMGVIATSVSTDLASTVKSIKEEAVKKEVPKEEVPDVAVA